MKKLIAGRRRLRTDELAAYASLSPATLQKLRVEGTGPRYLKVGHAVIYDTDDLDAWLQGRRDRAEMVAERLRTEDAAAYVGLSPWTLLKLRRHGGGPPWRKIGRLIVYEVEALDDWLASRRRLSTSDRGCMPEQVARS